MNHSSGNGGGRSCDWGGGSGGSGGGGGNEVSVAGKCRPCRREQIQLLL